MMNEMLQVHLVVLSYCKCLLHDVSLILKADYSKVLRVTKYNVHGTCPHVPNSLHIVSIVFTRTDNNIMHYADKVQSIQSIQAVSEAAYRQHITSDFIVSRRKLNCQPNLHILVCQ